MWYALYGFKFVLMYIACLISSLAFVQTDRETQSAVSSITLHAHPPGHQPQTSLNSLVAGVTWSSGGGPKSNRLQRELDGCDSLIDGSCNLKLPISFPAQATISSACSGHAADGHDASDNPFSEKMYQASKSIVTQCSPDSPTHAEDNPFAPSRHRWDINANPFS